MAILKGIFLGNINRYTFYRNFSKNFEINDPYKKYIDRTYIIKLLSIFIDFTISV